MKKITVPAFSRNNLHLFWVFLQLLLEVVNSGLNML